MLLLFSHNLEKRREKTRRKHFLLNYISSSVMDESIENYVVSLLVSNKKKTNIKLSPNCTPITLNTRNPLKFWLVALFSHFFFFCLLCRKNLILINAREYSRYINHREQYDFLLAIFPPQIIVNISKAFESNGTNNSPKQTDFNQLHNKIQSSFAICFCFIGDGVIVVSIVQPQHTHTHTRRFDCKLIMTHNFGQQH